jgi:hypothetical protein
MIKIKVIIQNHGPIRCYDDGCMHSKVAHFQQTFHSLKVHVVMLKW